MSETLADRLLRESMAAIDELEFNSAEGNPRVRLPGGITVERTSTGPVFRNEEGEVNFKKTELQQLLIETIRDNLRKPRYQKEGFKAGQAPKGSLDKWSKLTGG